ncbi:MAG: response regulator [Lachnospiraceae bacterium]|nr:response regulator [Lachnospiraceae bacterium]
MINHKKINSKDINDDAKKRVIVISEASGFILEAIVTNINKTDTLKASKMIADTGVVKNIPPETDMILLYLDESNKYSNKFLATLEDEYVNSNFSAPVFLLGDSNEVALAKKKLIKIPIVGVFNRPINVKETTEELCKVASNNKYHSKKRLLVVDDDPVMRVTLSGWLSNRYVFHSVNAGDNAIDFLKLHDVDLVLLDYEMPVLNGPQTLDLIRRDEDIKDTPVMFLTSRNDRESVLSVKDMGVERYLLKTLDSEDIVDAIHDFFVK